MNKNTRSNDRGGAGFPPVGRQMKTSLALLLIAGLAATSFAADLRSKARTLEIEMTEIKRIAWTRPGVPSGRYKEALQKHAELNPKLDSYGSQVIAISGSAEMTSKRRAALHKAGLDLRQQAEEFRVAWQKLGVLVPPRLSAALQPQVLETLDDIEALLP